MAAIKENKTLKSILAISKVFFKTVYSHNYVRKLFMVKKLMRGPGTFRHNRNGSRKVQQRRTRTIIALI